MHQVSSLAREVWTAAVWFGSSLVFPDGGLNFSSSQRWWFPLQMCQLPISFAGGNIERAAGTAFSWPTKKPGPLNWELITNSMCASSLVRRFPNRIPNSFHLTTRRFLFFYLSPFEMRLGWRRRHHLWILVLFAACRCIKLHFRMFFLYAVEMFRSLFSIIHSNMMSVLVSAVCPIWIFRLISRTQRFLQILLLMILS